MNSSGDGQTDNSGNSGPNQFNGGNDRKNMNDNQNQQYQGNSNYNGMNQQYGNSNFDQRGNQYNQPNQYQNQRPYNQNDNFNPGDRNRGNYNRFDQNFPNDRNYRGNCNYNDGYDDRNRNYRNDNYQGDYGRRDYNDRGMPGDMYQNPRFGGNQNQYNDYGRNGPNDYNRNMRDNDYMNGPNHNFQNFPNRRNDYDNYGQNGGNQGYGYNQRNMNSFNPRNQGFGNDYGNQRNFNGNPAPNRDNQGPWNDNDRYNQYDQRNPNPRNYNYGNQGDYGGNDYGPGNGNPMDNQNQFGQRNEKYQNDNFGRNQGDYGGNDYGNGNGNPMDNQNQFGQRNEKYQNDNFDRNQRNYGGNDYGNGQNYNQGNQNYQNDDFGGNDYGNGNSYNQGNQNYQNDNGYNSGNGNGQNYNQGNQNYQNGYGNGNSYNQGNQNYQNDNGYNPGNGNGQNYNQGNQNYQNDNFGGNDYGNGNSYNQGNQNYQNDNGYNPGNGQNYNDNLSSSNQNSSNYGGGFPAGGRSKDTTLLCDEIQKNDAERIEGDFVKLDLNIGQVTDEEFEDFKLKENIKIVGQCENKLFQFNPQMMLPELYQNIRDQNWNEPTPIQKIAIPAILAGRNIVGIAQTGSGKTAVYLIPAITYVINQNKKRGPHVLIMANTRDLAKQIEQVGAILTRNTPVKVAVAHGGENNRRQQIKDIQGADIIAAAPGRLLDFIKNKIIQTDSIGIVVIDEADIMVSNSFYQQIRSIISNCPKNIQTLMFSATWPEDVQFMAREYLGDCLRIIVNSRELTVNINISHYIFPKDRNEIKQLTEIIDRILDSGGVPKIIIFCNQKVTVEWIHDVINRQIRAVFSHGNVNQKFKEKALEEFKYSKKPIAMVCTSALSRGIDVIDITHVVNFDMPTTIEEYAHRVGRTGRVDRTGVAISLFDKRKDDKLRENLINYLKEAQQNIPEFLQ